MLYLLEGCIAEGHPVDVVSGTVFTEQQKDGLSGICEGGFETPESVYSPANE